LKYVFLLFKNYFIKSKNLEEKYMYKVRQKSNPLKLLAVFSATTWEFQCEILHIYVNILSTLHCQAEFNNIYIRLSY